MRRTKIILSMAMAFAVMPIADNARADVVLPMPAGKWARKNENCKSPYVEITQKSLIYIFDKGRGICNILSLKKQKNGFYYGKTEECKWDKGVPDEVKGGDPDSEDNAFSIKPISDNKILFNNIESKRCD